MISTGLDPVISPSADRAVPPHAFLSLKEIHLISFVQSKLKLKYILPGIVHVHILIFWVFNDAVSIIGPVIISHHKFNESYLPLLET